MATVRGTPASTRLGTADLLRSRKRSPGAPAHKQRPMLAETVNPPGVGIRPPPPRRIILRASIRCLIRLRSPKLRHFPPETPRCCGHSHRASECNHIRMRIALPAQSDDYIGSSWAATNCPDFSHPLARASLSFSGRQRLALERSSGLSSSPQEHAPRGLSVARSGTGGSGRFLPLRDDQ
jgi:hypothetical protein